MFVILAYDVAAKRDGKVVKTCKRYLSHVQRSVFEGMLTEAELRKLKQEIRKVIHTDEDVVSIYEFDSMKYSTKEIIGVSPAADNIL